MKYWAKSYFDDDFRKTSLEPAIGRAEQEVNLLESIINPPQSGTILDLCCGIGRHTIQLARRGYNVVAIDFIRDYLDFGKKAVGKESFPISSIERDMHDLEFDCKFDVVINMWSSFGLSETDQEDLNILKLIYRSLKKDGILILDILNRDNVVKYFRPYRWRETPVNHNNKITVLEKNELDLMSSHINTNWIYIKNGKSIPKFSSIRLFSLHEISSWLNKVGFKIVSSLGFKNGGLQENIISPEVHRIWIVANK